MGAVCAPPPVHPVPRALLVLEGALAPRRRQPECTAPVRERGAGRTGYEPPLSTPPRIRASLYCLCLSVLFVQIFEANYCTCTVL